MEALGCLWLEFFICFIVSWFLAATLLYETCQTRYPQHQVLLRNFIWFLQVNPTVIDKEQYICISLQKTSVADSWHKRDHYKEGPHIWIFYSYYTSICWASLSLVPVWWIQVVHIATLYQGVQKSTHLICCVVRHLELYIHWAFTATPRPVSLAAY